MINPNNPTHRQRLARAVDNSFQELQRYGRMRDNTIKAYLGSSPGLADWDWMGRNDKYRKALPKGNLLQQGGLSLQIALAYGEPEFLAVPRVPQHTGIATKLAPALNRMSKLLDFGETARMVAADSYFGYGIFKVGMGHLPLSARAATGLNYGPCIWRVSQDDFIYDITASDWRNCDYIGDIYDMPLDEAQELYPNDADRLATMCDVDRLDSPHVFARPSRFYSPQLKVWFADFHIPGTNVVATWPVRNESFSEMANAPVAVHDYDGHWSGVYSVLNHLYAPDEIVPIAQAESTKALHFLFNDLLHLTSEQALNAKVNPLYQAGSDKDMRRIWDAADRRPVSVVDSTRFSQFEIPGPTGSQTQYMAAVMQFFKQFTPTVDQPERAPTATQGTQVRETTNAVVTEARRKFNRCLQLVGYKLGHLLMNNDDLVLPSSRPLAPGSKISIDTTWQPQSVEPRVAKIDDLDLGIEAYSTQYRSPEARLQGLLAASNQIALLMQAKAQGSPINIEEAIDDIATYSGLPELRDWYEEAFPMQAVQRQSSQMSVPRLGVGNYTRTNVSEKTTAGALEANLNGIGSENGQPRFE